MMRSRSILGIGLLAGCCVLALACASYGVRTDYDLETDFSEFESYRWLEPPPARDPRLENDLIRKRIRRAVDDELAAKGLTPREAGEPDLFVTYHAIIERKVDIETTHYGYGYRRYGSRYSEVYAREYEVGTLIIDLVDADSRELVWRGSGQAQLNQDVSPERREQRVRAVVAAILADYPPKD